MALLNPIASAPGSEVDAFRRDPGHVVVASLIGRLSSFGMGGWTDPFGVLLQEVMLKGQVISANVEHDRDVPRFHDPARVRDLRRRMDEAARTVAVPPPDSYEEWARSEFDAAHRIVVHAADRGECVVTGWEVIGGVHGVPLRLRLRSPEDDRRAALARKHIALPLPVSVGSALFALVATLLVWRKTRMDARRRRGGS